MKPLELNWKTLGELDDSHAAGLIENELAELVKDIRDRAKETRARVLKIELALRPAPGDQVTLVVRVGSKRPGMQTRAHKGRFRQSRGETVIAFVPDNPNDGAQPTLTPDEPAE